MFLVYTMPPEKGTCIGIGVLCQIQVFALITLKIHMKTMRGLLYGRKQNKPSLSRGS